MPAVFRRSPHFGRMPVARNRPTTLPSCVTPAFSNVKISCMVMMSPSMPVISEMLVTLRVPSLNRDCWTTIWMAAAICWRIARRVGVHGRERAVVSRVHRLQHVERFFAPDLADDDAVRAHAERVHDKL